MKKILNKTPITIALLVIALTSFFIIEPVASNASTYGACTKVLNEKSETLALLAGSATAVSVAITLIPDDAGTPVANKLADFTTYFLLITSLIYLEKYLLVTFGFAAWKIIMPIACIIALLGFYTEDKSLKKLALKTSVFAIILNLSIPASLYVTNLIETQYNDSIQETIDLAEDTSDTIEKDKENVHWYSSITNAYNDATDCLKDIVNRFINALAIMIVTTFLIPILTFVFLLYLLKFFFGVPIKSPTDYYKEFLELQNKNAETNN